MENYYANPTLLKNIDRLERIRVVCSHKDWDFNNSNLISNNVVDKALFIINRTNMQPSIMPCGDGSLYLEFGSVAEVQVSEELCMKYVTVDKCECVDMIDEEEIAFIDVADIVNILCKKASNEKERPF
jgi:hypothetical protein